MQEQSADWLDGRLAADPAWAGGDDIDVLLDAPPADAPGANADVESTGEVELSPSWLDDAPLGGAEVVDGLETIVVSEAEVADAMVLLADAPAIDPEFGMSAGLDDALADGDAVEASADAPGPTIDPFDVFLATNPVEADLDDVDGAGLGDSLVDEIDADDVAPADHPVVAAPSFDESAGRPAADDVDAGASVEQATPDLAPDESWSPSPTSGLDAFDQLGLDRTGDVAVGDTGNDAGIHADDAAFDAGHRDDASDHTVGGDLGDDDLDGGLG